MRKGKATKTQVKKSRLPKKVEKVIKAKGYLSGRLPKGKELQHVKPVNATYDYKAWWERLIFSQSTKKIQLCPSCNHPNDSIDVVCSKDATALVGLKLDDRCKALIINGLRILAFGVALAVGYMFWFWPTYVFISVVMCAFFALFLRNHQTILRYFVIITSIGFLVQVAWLLALQQILTFVQVLGLIFLLLLLTELVFLIAFTLRIKRVEQNARWSWLKSKDIDLPAKTLAWIAFMLTALVLCLVIAFGAWRLDQLPFNETISRIALRLSLSALWASVVVALVSSTIFSLRGEPFRVLDKWIFRPIFQEQRFKQIPIPEKRVSKSWKVRFTNILDRAFVISTNKMVQAFEKAYNWLIVHFSNLLFRNTLQFANTVRRTGIKLVRHLVRTLHRFIVINVWCVLWAWYTETRFFITYALPLLLSLIIATIMYSMASNFFHYVHQGPVLLALVFFLQLIGVVLLLTIVCSLLMHVNILSKMLDALTVFGPNAFLFFLLTAWSIGIFGMITDGPYKVGPVTIFSTIAVIVMFVLNRQRSKNRGR